MSLMIWFNHVLLSSRHYLQSRCKLIDTTKHRFASISLIIYIEISHCLWPNFPQLQTRSTNSICSLPTSPKSMNKIGRLEIAHNDIATCICDRYRAVSLQATLCELFTRHEVLRRHRSTCYISSLWRWLDIPERPLGRDFTNHRLTLSCCCVCCVYLVKPITDDERRIHPSCLAGIILKFQFECLYEMLRCSG